MSLSTHDQQALDAIEDRLTGGAPELAALLATFTRLVSGEEMPARERIRPPGRQAAGHIGRRLRWGGQVLLHRLGRKRTMLLVWLTVAISLITVALMLNRSAGRGGCTAPWQAVCAGQAFAGGAGRIMPPGLGAAVQ